jgi:hypothetical protein
VVVLISMPVWEGLKGLIYVTADGATGITVIVCAAGRSDSDMPSTVMPGFPPDSDAVGFGEGVATDVGAVGEEESPPPHPATVSTATTPTASLRRVSMSGG